MSAVQLSRETADLLRAEFSAGDETDWVLRLARQKGWRQANQSYLEAMRMRGAEEMASLMDATGVGKRPSLDEAPPAPANRPLSLGASDQYQATTRR